MAQTNLTLNQVIASFRTFATEHKQIHVFGFGDPVELNASHNIVGPVMWVDILPCTLEQRVLKLKVAVVFGDLAHKDGSDFEDVLSDRLQVALDFVSWLQGEHEDLDLTSSVALEPFVDKTDHVLTGWTCTTYIDVPFFSDYCSIPR